MRTLNMSGLAIPEFHHTIFSESTLSRLGLRNDPPSDVIVSGSGGMTDADFPVPGKP
jgi:hypothetical protein